MRAKIKIISFFSFSVFLLIVLSYVYPGSLYCQDRVNIILAGDNSGKTSMNARFSKDIDFVRILELADFLEAQTYYVSFTKKIILILGKNRIKVTAFNPFVMIDKLTFQMPVSTDFDEEGIWVPMDYFIDLIADYFPTPISYDRDTHTLLMVKEGVNILDVIIEEKSNGTLIRIPTLRNFDIANIKRRVSQSWMYIDVYGGKVDSTSLAFSNSRGIVRKLIPIQFEQSTQLSFLLRKEVELADVSLSSAGNEILVSIRTSDKIPENFIVDMDEERKKWLIDKIIIDPGHGGKDPGTVGYGGLKEKDVVLEISKRLKKLIEQQLNIPVMMTRERDKFVKLRDRSAFANRNGGKLFISIHANSVKEKSARGAETFCFGVARNEEDRAIAERENSVIKYEDSWADYNEENYILSAITQNSFNLESQQLAAEVQKELPKALNTKNRPLKQGIFQVFVGTSMPKILVEVGFISNVSEAKKLRDEKYQQRVAERIFIGIKRFKESSEKSVLSGLSNDKNK